MASISFFLGLLALASIFVLIRILCRYLKRSPLDNLPGPPSGSLLLGNILLLRDPVTAGKFTASLCETYGPAHRIHGVLGERLLVVFDPRALHCIFVQDIDNFPKEVTPLNTLSLLLGPGILATNGSQHRRQRKLLNSAFSRTHLQEMSLTVHDVAYNLLKTMREHCREKGHELDINACMAKTALEVMGNAFLGYSFGSFVEDGRDTLGESFKLFFTMIGKVPSIAFLVPALSRFLPGSLIFRLFRLVPFSPNLHRLLDISENLRRRATEIVEMKKAALL
ncbi:cytochrome P450 [Lentinus tigrinus ALCF2SS1-6]|uniref:Cytochrome P450 n=1 Tax=Lentinus tigrinus ALCF2SS1-6 TaxID=1328759 RepID=A0A5C2SH05_9APHY|nr:cytochrome P450 [Lentinus tigrinus ALCF2SS1-6]